MRVAAPALVRSSAAAPRFGVGAQVLVTLMLLAVIASLVGTGTFASFNSITRNAASITSGTLVLGDKVNAGSECFSAGGAAPSNPQLTTGATQSSGCSGLWSVAGQLPGTTISPLKLTVRNAGNLQASALKVYASASGCVDTTNGAGYHGGNLCAGIQLEVQQYTDNTFGTPSHCWYGSGTATTCTAEANKLPGGCNVSTCTSYNFSDATHTLSNFGSTVTSAAPINTGTLAGGGSAYFLVFAGLPGTTTNDATQGERADLTFTFEMVS